MGGTAAGAAALTATALYRAAPGFWRQFAKEWNRPVEPPPSRPDPRKWPDRGLFAAWLGHATVLLKIDGYTVLTDPVFSTRAGLNVGPLTLGIKRLVEPALPLENLPEVDLILLSHAHMDHFDLPSLRGLQHKNRQVITAWSTSDLLEVGKYASVQELRWGQTAHAGPLEVHAFEVNHWGARMRSDTYRGYNGYVLKAGAYRVMFAGDTAETNLFRQLASTRGIDLGIMPIGAYNPWIHYHCTPEQAWRMGNDARAEVLLPVHHQTFSLSREPRFEPIDRFVSAAGTAYGRVAVRMVGEEFQLA